MRRVRGFSLGLIITSAIFAAGISGADEAKIPAFPGAEGFGAMTPGGRGGRVVFVTNLNDSGPGSLRQALEGETGKRIVIFRVGGTIALTRNIRIREENSYVTVAGQTAPGDGIQLKNHTIGISNGGHDVVVRYLRTRPGTGGIRIITEGTFKGKSTGMNIDGFLLYGNQGTHVHHVVVDHCSVGWAVDENLEAWGWVSDVTYQWCIAAEGTMEGHHKGPHGAGMIFGGGAGGRTSISVHHCLFAHNMMRNPLLGGKDAIADFRNNVVYNWSNNNAAQLWGGLQINFVNNVYLRGPNVGPDKFIWLQAPARIYLEGNWGPGCPRGCSDEWGHVFQDYSWHNRRRKPGSEEVKVGTRVDAPFPTPRVTTHPTGTLKELVLANVGAALPKRDAVDERIVRDVRDGTGEIGPGSGYPQLKSGVPPKDGDGDGMPDDWERAHRLNPSDPRDGNKQAPSGYTWIEEYINSLVVMPAMTGANKSGVYRSR